MNRSFLFKFFLICFVLFDSNITTATQPAPASALRKEPCQEKPSSVLPALYNNTEWRIPRALSGALRWLATSRPATKLGGFFPSFAAKKIPLLRAITYRLHQRNIQHFMHTNNINDESLKKFKPGSHTPYTLISQSYATFSEFFERELEENEFKNRVAECRQITQSSAIISPADCQMCVIQNLKPSTKFSIKDGFFNLAKFLNLKEDGELVKYYQGGTLMIFRLRPMDYHHYHYPFKCSRSPATPISGRLDSVNPAVYEAGLVPIIGNERRRMILTPYPETGGTSDVIAVVIGALMVGKIIIIYEDFNLINLSIGDEWGHFSFGASSIALIFKKDAIAINKEILDDLKAKRGALDAAKRPNALAEVYVEMGQIIAHFNKVTSAK